MQPALHNLKIRLLRPLKRADNALLRFFEKPAPRAVAKALLFALTNFRQLYVWPMEKTVEYLYGRTHKSR